MYTYGQWRNSDTYPDWRVSPAPDPGGIDRACYFDNELEALVWWYNQPNPKRWRVFHWNDAGHGWTDVTPESGT